jgi:hypothetical protein
MVRRLADWPIEYAPDVTTLCCHNRVFWGSSRSTGIDSVGRSGWWLRLKPDPMMNPGTASSAESGIVTASCPRNAAMLSHGQGASPDAPRARSQRHIGQIVAVPDTPDVPEVRGAARSRRLRGGRPRVELPLARLAFPSVGRWQAAIARCLAPRDCRLAGGPPCHGCWRMNSPNAPAHPTGSRSVAISMSRFRVVLPMALSFSIVAATRRWRHAWGGRTPLHSIHTRTHVHGPAGHIQFSSVLEGQ